MNNIEKAVQTPPCERPEHPVEMPVPDKKNTIKNNLKLLLMLTAIYSLIINQSQKINIPATKKPGNIKNEVSAKKDEANGDQIIKNASLLMVKE